MSAYVRICTSGHAPVRKELRQDERQPMKRQAGQRHDERPSAEQRMLPYSWNSTIFLERYHILREEGTLETYAYGFVAM